MNMKKSFSLSSITIVLLVIVVLVMSIGYAGFSRNLEINGNAAVGAASWNVRLVKDSYSESKDSVTVTADNLKINETSMTYDITLTEPGQFYEFTINVENAGTFDAYLGSITLGGVSTEQKNYIKYELSYNNITYTEGMPNFKLESGSTVPVKVLVEYFQPSDPTLLPDAEQDLQLTATLNFVQTLEDLDTE